MKRRLILLIISIGALHFSLSIILFLMFGIGLENRSIGSEVFWYFQQPVLGLTLLGFIPDFKLMAFPLNSLLWGIIITVIINLYKNGQIFFFDGIKTKLH